MHTIILEDAQDYVLPYIETEEDELDDIMLAYDTGDVPEECDDLR